MIKQPPYRLFLVNDAPLWGSVNIRGIQLPIHWAVTFVAVTMLHLVIFYGFQAKHTVEYTPNPIGDYVIPVKYITDVLEKEKDVDLTPLASRPPPKKGASITTSELRSEEVHKALNVTPQEGRLDGIQEGEEEHDQDSSERVGTPSIILPIESENPKEKIVLVQPVEESIWTLNTDVLLDPRDDLRRLSCLRQAQSIDLTVDKEARICARFPPIMPWQAKTSGYCRVKYKILPNGRSHQIKVHSCTDLIFAETSAKSVKKWSFIPEVKGGRAVESKTFKAIITYRLINKNGEVIGKEIFE